ncbi:MAG: hypothetical protein QNJ72_39820 [Pleurocapsa sp. MO_226.B13]|nr:hypothetical protein [Pleurocapsa sp. MO_226.B13]
MNDELSPSEQSPSSPFEDRSSPETRDSEKIRVSIDLDSEILDRIKHLTNDPSRVIETAIKQWLNGERDGDTDLTRTFRRNPPVPPQGEWND